MGGIEHASSALRAEPGCAARALDAVRAHRDRDRWSPRLRPADDGGRCGERGSAQFLILDLAIGLTYIVSGMIAWQRRPEVLTGPLLLLCGVLNFVGSYGPTERPVLTTLGFAFEGYYDVALAVLVLALPGRLPQGRSRVVAIAFGAAFLVRSLSRLLLLDFATLPDCEGCPSNPFAIATNLAAYETIETLSSLAIAVLALTVASICLGRLLDARPLRDACSGRYSPPASSRCSSLPSTASSPPTAPRRACRCWTCRTRGPRSGRGQMCAGSTAHPDRLPRRIPAASHGRWAIGRPRGGSRPRTVPDPSEVG